MMSCLTKKKSNLKVIRREMSTIPVAITFIYCKCDLWGAATVNFKWQPQNCQLAAAVLRIIRCY